MLKGWPVSKSTTYSILIILALGLLEGSGPILGLLTETGSGDFSVWTLPFSWNAKFHYFPLVLLDWLQIPSPVAIAVLLVLFHVAGGIFAFFLAREYINDCPAQNERSAFFIPLFAGVLYMMFPWNAFGDNFPTLVLIRAMAPLVLLLLLSSLRREVYRFAVLAGLALGIMTTADPRSIIYVLPISLLIITLPELLAKAVTLRVAFKANLTFIALSILASFVEIYYRLPGVVAGEGGVSSSSPAASINSDAFIPNFTHASPIHFLAGISFEGTYQDFTGLLSSVSLLAAFAVALAISFTLVIILYCLLVLRGEDRRRALPIVLSIGLTAMLFTVWVPGDSLPYLIKVLLGTDLFRNSSTLSTLLIMFRTMRFPNLLLLLALIPLVSMVLRDLLPRWAFVCRAIMDIEPLSRKVLSKKLREIRFQKAIAIGAVFVLMISGMAVWLIPQVARGQGMSFVGGITFETTEESIDLSNVIAQINQDPTVERILAIQPINDGLPNMYMYQDVEGGVSQYMVHYAVDTLYSPAIQDRDYNFLADLLKVMGVGYVVVNGYMITSFYGSEYGDRMVETPSYATILSELNASDRFSRVAEEGAVTAYKVIDRGSGTEGMYVLGGLEDFRKAYSYISNLTASNIMPMTLDSYFQLENLIELPDWPVLIGAHKTLDDLTASLAILTSTGMSLAPSEWVTDQWAPHENWSPGYIQDKIGGDLSPLFLDLTNYEWSFSYTPNTGYAFIEGAYDTISKELDLDTQDYMVLVRTLYSPEGGELCVRVDNATYYLNTNWRNESSEFLWTSLGSMTLDSESVISLESRGGINAVNSILVISRDEWARMQEASARFLEGRTIIVTVDPEKQMWDTYLGTTSTELDIIVGGNYSLLSDSNMNVSIGSRSGLTSGDDVNLEKGIHEIRFSELLTSVYSEDFENPSIIGTRSSYRWSPTNLWFEWSIDNSTWTTGGSSLNLTTEITNNRLWSNIRSPIIRVTPGEECTVSLDMKWYNAHQSHVTIEGIREDGSAYRLTMVMPGQDHSSNWTSFSNTFRVPEGTVGIRLTLMAGAVYNSLYPTTTWFDNITVEQAIGENPSLLLVNGELVGSSLQVGDANVSVAGGYTNTYTFTVSGKGTGIAHVPELFYGTTTRVTYEGVQVTEVPIFLTYTGLIVTSKNDSTGTVIVKDPVKIMIGQLSIAIFASILALGAILLLSLVWGPWRIKQGGDKAYLRGTD